MLFTIDKNQALDKTLIIHKAAPREAVKAAGNHPGSTTHSQLNEEELLAAGITPGYVRLSIGLEHADDIIADFVQALAKI